MTSRFSSIPYFSRFLLFWQLVHLSVDLKAGFLVNVHCTVPIYVCMLHLFWIKIALMYNCTCVYNCTLNVTISCKFGWKKHHLHESQARKPNKWLHSGYMYVCAVCTNKFAYHVASIVITHVLYCTV